MFYFRHFIFRFKSRVETEKPSYVQTFYIKNYDCSKKLICRTLFVALTNPFPLQKLDIQFCGKLNTTIRRGLADYKYLITSLDLQVWKNKDFLLDKRLIFKNLRSLTLWRGKNGYDKVMKVVCESMIGKHADKLKKLRIVGLQVNLRTPALPVLESVELDEVCSEATWSILKQCKQTITSLEIYYGELDGPILWNNLDPNRFIAFDIPNLENLALLSSDPFTVNFIVQNAHNLVSLSVDCFQIDMDLDLSLKDYPNLRELDIDNHRLLPILEKSRETLECLLIMDNPHVCNNVGVLPRLTDLYILTRFQDPRNSKVLTDNSLSLEFIFLDGVDISSLDDGLRMVEMRMVVMESYYRDQDREKMARLCPNAKVIMFEKNTKIEVVDYVRHRRKFKGFYCDFRFIDEYYI
jgi:hypothetical protein